MLRWARLACGDALMDTTRRSVSDDSDTETHYYSVDYAETGTLE